VIPSAVQQDEHVGVCFVVADSVDEAGHGVCAGEELQVNGAAIFHVDNLRQRSRAQRRGSLDRQRWRKVRNQIDCNRRRAALHGGAVGFQHRVPAPY
jgi:hypothetical protein